MARELVDVLRAIWNLEVDQYTEDKLFEIHAAVEDLEFEISHAALVDEFNIVRKVIVIPYCNDNDTDITAYCNGIGLPGTWLDTAYLGARRGKYAGIGDHYDPVANVFYTPHINN